MSLQQLLTTYYLRRSQSRVSGLDSCDKLNHTTEMEPVTEICVSDTLTGSPAYADGTAGHETSARLILPTVVCMAPTAVLKSLHVGRALLQS